MVWSDWSPLEQRSANDVLAIQLTELEQKLDEHTYPVDGDDIAAAYGGDPLPGTDVRLDDALDGTYGEPEAVMADITAAVSASYDAYR